MKWLKYILFSVGILAVAWLIYEAGPNNIWKKMKEIGPLGLLFIIPYLAVYVTDTWGWKWSFCSNVELPSFWKLVKIKLAGEAINYTLPGGYIGGEPLKAIFLAKQKIPLSHGLASVLIGKFLMTLAEVAFILIGLNLAFLSLENKGILLSALIGLFLFGIALAFFLRLQKRGLASFLSKGLNKIQVTKKWIASYQEAISQFDNVLAQYYNDKSRMFVGVACFFMGWCCGASEIYIFLTLMGQSIPIYQILVLEAMFVTIKGMGTVVPGSVGIQEGGIAGTFMLFHLDKTLGITFGLLRRSREILWIIIGLLFLYQEWDSDKILMIPRNLNDQENDSDEKATA